MKRVIPIAFLALVTTAHADTDSSSENVVMKALQDELSRSTTLQLNGMPKPYFAALEADDNEWVSVRASFGKLVHDDVRRSRDVGSRVRIGDYASDSGNFVDDSFRYRSAGDRGTSLDDRYDAIRHDAWLSMDTTYKSALDHSAKKAAIREGQETAPERVDDFSHEAPTVLVDMKAPASLDRQRAVRLARALSELGGSAAAFRTSSTSISLMSRRSYLVTSEGTKIVQPSVNASIETVFRAQADDGMRLSTYRSIATCSMDTLPSDDAILADARQAATELEEIRKAPLVDDFSGPILFEGAAAAQIVWNTLAHDMLGTPPPVSSEKSFRHRDDDSGLAGRVGERILPTGFDLEDDPTIDHLGALPLAGCYKVDDEGVPAQKVTLVQDGIFKSFLMSRTPRKGFPKSNGHGRASQGDERISAMIANFSLSSKRGLAQKELRARAIAEAKAQKKPYVIVVERLVDRFTEYLDATHAELFSSYARRDGGTKLLVAWKLGLDGSMTRVRGGALGDVYLKTFKDILAAGNTPSVIGFAGNGGHSVTSPALLFKDLEIKKSRDATKHPPILPRPE